jgi:hypothetical protein
MARRRGQLVVAFAAVALIAAASAANAQIVLPPGGDPAPPSDPTPGAGANAPATKAPNWSRKSPKGVFTRTFKLKRASQKQRMVVLCPRGRFPLGGGMFNTPPVSPDGEGIYPHSYERLGVQGGFHTTTVYWPAGGAAGTPTRRVTLQVACTRRWLGHMTPPHRTKYVGPGQTKTVVAKCPGRRRHLIGGGFQRTDFVGRGGDYVTESRATSSKTWRVTASAFGGFGGEITAIAYCLRRGHPLVKQVSSRTVSIEKGEVGYVRTPRCPGKRRLVYGGFKTFPKKAAFMTDGRFHRNQSWSTAAFNNFGPTVDLTAYGYCF